jgi:hypothetical protein
MGCRMRVFDGGYRKNRSPISQNGLPQTEGKPQIRFLKFPSALSKF